MAKPQVSLSNSFNEWRIITNTLSDEIGDIALIVPDQAFTPTDIVVTLNDLYTKKVNRSGDTITGNFIINGTLRVDSATTLQSTLAVTGDLAVNTNKFVVTAASGNTVIAGTLTVAGAVTASTTFNSVGNFSVNTNKFTVAASTGNTVVAGTLAVAGTSTLAAVSATTATTTGSLSVGTTANVVGDFSVNTNKFVVTAASGNTAIAGTLAVAGVSTMSNTIVSTLGTISSIVPAFDGTQTWNNAATAFSAIRLVVTNTASAFGSKLLDLTIGANSYGVDRNCTIVQVLDAPNLARDVKGAAGSRHVREYQDLTDDGVQGLLGSPGVSTHSFEWGFTWNAKWDRTISEYVKDRSNAGDHAFMFRVSKKFNQEWWWSDGTTAGSAISWVNKVTFDLPTDTYTFKNGVNTTTITPTEVTTATVNATDKLIVGSISYFDAIETTLATLTPTVIASMPVAAYRSAQFEIQAVDATGGKYHRTNLSFIHNGTISESVEYGAVNLGGLCATFTTQLNAGNVEIIATPTSANSTVFRLHVRMMAV